MKVSADYLNYAMDRLSSIDNIMSRAMFGGYGIFHEGLMFALIADDTLYFKVDESNRDIYEKAESQPFPHGISYWEVPADILEDKKRLGEWAKISMDIAIRKARKKRR
ncbi:MAG: TfoX/Sxy family protein [Dehalococcoidales bacterium]|nr:TfoX/Sxy family protein [Dehalococcoidales bacterium]